MILARSKNGAVGRQVKSVGEKAIVEAPRLAERRSDLYISTRSIDEDEAYWKAQENKARAEYQAQMLRADYEKRAQKLIDDANRKKVLSEQAKKPLSVEDTQVKAYVARTMGLSETEKVSRSISADFDINVEVKEAGKLRPIVPRADFRLQSITGNPLTRDGSYGVVTDYDRFVRGQELDNDLVPTGGTMLRRPMSSEFGFSWDSVTNWLDTTASNTMDQLSTQLPGTLATAAQQELIKQIQSGQAAQQVVVQQPVQMPNTYSIQAGQQMISGIPNWALFAGLGMVGIGLMFMIVKK